MYRRLLRSIIEFYQFRCAFSSFITCSLSELFGFFALVEDSIRRFYELMLGKIPKTIIFLSVFISAISSFVLNVSLYFGITLFIALIFLATKRIISVRFSLILFLLFFISTFYASIRTPEGDLIEDFVYQNIEAQGVISSSVKKIDGKSKFIFDVSSVSSEQNSREGRLGKIAVTLYKADDIKIADKLVVKGKLYKPFYAKNLGQFDYADYLAHKGVFTTLYSSKYQIIGFDESVYYQLVRKFNQFRKKIMLAHNQHLSEFKSAFLGGVIFGYRAVDIPENIKQNFINSGLLHLLSASGLHVGLILGIWFFICRLCRFSFTFGILSSGIVVFLYSCFTGFPPSIMRAMLMAEFILLGNLIDRKADNIALLLLVCSIMLLYEPMYAYNIGFQLSFVVTFGILFCLPYFLEKFHKIPDYIVGCVFVPIIAQLFASPLLIYHFNAMSLYSVFANILVVPFMAVVSFVGFLASIFALIPFMNWAIFLLDKIVQPFLDVLLGVSACFSSLPNSLLYIAKPVLISIFVFYGCVILIMQLLKKDCYKQAFVVFVSLVLLLFGLNFDFNFSQKFKMIFFSVGNGDSILVELPNKKNFIVDSGKIGFGKYNSGNSIINPYLKNKGITSLDAMVLTHPDSDHIGGALSVLKYTNLRDIYTIDKRCKSNVCKRLNEYINKNNLNVNYPKTNEELTLDKDVTVEFIVPSGVDKSTFNDDSIITYIRYADFSALLMGDNEVEVLDLIKAHIKKPVNVLKVGHHGSKKSLNKAMLSYLKPEIAILCVGKNGFGHPNANVLKLLKNYNVKTYRTDKDNMIELYVDNDCVHLSVFDREDKKMRKIF